MSVIEVKIDPTIGIKRSTLQKHTSSKVKYAVLAIYSTFVAWNILRFSSDAEISQLTDMLVLFWR